MDLVPSQSFSEARAIEYFTRAASDALAVGLTSVHDAFSVPEEIQFYKKYVTHKFPKNVESIIFQTFRDSEAAC
jgi:hypothetical protein